MEQNQKKKRKDQRLDAFPFNNFQTVQSILHQGPSQTDPEGMYTGNPVHRFEDPVQDSDDL